MKFGKSVKTVQRLVTVETLYKAGGKVEDSSGRATIKLQELVGSDATQGFTSNLKRMEDEGIITRKINGKRCYSIELANVPEGWLPETPKVEEEVKREVQEETPLIPEKIEKPTEVEHTEDVDYDKLAAHLLKSVVEVIARGDKSDTQGTIDTLQRDIEQARDRLASVLEDNQRLRDKNRSNEDLIKALHTERDGLRRQKVDLERVIATMQNPNNRRSTQEILGEIGRKDLQRIMQERPTNPLK